MTSHTHFRLGAVLVDPEHLRLSSKAATLQVQPRVMDVIVALSRQGTALVSRPSLTEQVWGETHVGYHALARAICEARKAFATVAPDQEFVQTVPQRGYRMLVMREDVAEPRASPGPILPGSLFDSIKGRVALAMSTVVVLGLCTHAIDAHGSPLHLVSAAAIIGVILWSPLFAAADRSPAA